LICRLVSLTACVKLLKIILTSTQKSSQDLPQPAAIKYKTPHWRQQLWLNSLQGWRLWDINNVTITT